MTPTVALKRHSPTVIQTLIPCFVRQVANRSLVQLRGRRELELHSALIILLRGGGEIEICKLDFFRTSVAQIIKSRADNRIIRNFLPVAVFENENCTRLRRNRLRGWLRLQLARRIKFGTIVLVQNLAVVIVARSTRTVSWII